MSKDAVRRQVPRHRGKPRPVAMPTLATLALLAASGSATAAALAQGLDRVTADLRPTAAGADRHPTVDPSTGAHPPAAEQLSEQPSVAPASTLADTVTGPIDATRSRGTVVVLADTVVDTAPVPSRAVVAYQRAEAVMGKAMQACALDWPLLAGIGGVLTGHGSRDGAGTITDEGIVRPALIGDPLTDSAGVPISDTDSGVLDSDVLNDRPIGPFLLDPVAWQTVAVDADGDGERNPQDLDDAALAASVMLCASGEDLRVEAHLREALARFTPEEEFGDLVLTAAAEHRAAARSVPAAPSVPIQYLPARSPAPSGADRGGAPDQPPGKPAKTPQVAASVHELGKLNGLEEETADDLAKTEPVDADEDLQDPVGQPDDVPVAEAEAPTPAAPAESTEDGPWVVVEESVDATSPAPPDACPGSEAVECSA